MIIGFDVDGILYPWHEEIYDYFVNDRNYKGTYHKFWTEYIPTIHGTILMDNVVLDPTMYSHKSIKSEYLKVLNELDSDGWKIWYISSVPKSIALDRVKWYRDNKLPQYKNYSFPYGLSKLDAVMDAKCDYFVEDRTQTILELMEHTFVFVVNKPWNEKLGAIGEFERINSVVELPDYLLGDDKSGYGGDLYV